MKYAVLARLIDNDQAQTLGHMTLFDGHKVLFSCRTLELPDRDNRPNISRIPAATYMVQERYSPKHLYHYHIHDVEGRTWILIHPGNRKDQIEGCILVGDRFEDINNDGHLDVTNSRMTMNKLLTEAGKEFKLIILDIDNFLI